MTKLLRTGLVAAVGAPLLLLGACAPPPPPCDACAVAQHAETTANQALSTAQEALKAANEAREAAARMYHRGLRK